MMLWRRHEFPDRSAPSQPEYPMVWNIRSTRISGTIYVMNEELQQADESLEDIARCLERVFVTELPPDPEETVQQMLWFIRGGKTEEERHKPSRGSLESIRTHHSISMKTEK